MSNLTTSATTEIVAQVPPGERAVSIMALEAAQKHATKIGDLEALRRAVHEKLAQQAGAALDYSALFPSGRPKKSADSADFSREDWLRQLGKSDDTVRRWRERLIDEAARAQKAEEIVARTAKLCGLDVAASYSSESNEWYTPERYITAVRDLYGGVIDLDPATSAKANETVQAAQIFTEADGEETFTADWHGRAFMNPPYGIVKGESLAGRFCRKAIAELEIGNLEACVILVNSVHSQKWQAPLYQYPVCFVDHRISFVSGSGESNENPTFSNIFVYLGSDLHGFAERFSVFGYVMTPYQWG